VKNSVHELVQSRYSCRNYLQRPLEDAHREGVAAALASLGAGPLGNPCRFALLAATQDDRAALKGLGTYGFIKGATAFVVGAVRPAPGDMEDYGYCLERAVLEATDLGLGTCWLGGTFTKSSFARRIGAQPGEVIPAVVAVGYPKEDSRKHWLRRSVGSERRLPHSQLFLEGSSTAPLDLALSADLADVLETVRWAPSASNKQPWRLLRSGRTWHFYLERTPGYGKGLFSALVTRADLQRVDMGIAMCHFELAAREAGLVGRWVIEQPALDTVPAGWEYTASWAS
jgi:nitroreductase